MVDDSNGDCKVKEGIRMREGDIVSHDGRVLFMLGSDSDQVFGAVTVGARVL